MMKIIKFPEFENDDILIKIENFNLTNEQLIKCLDNDNYLKTKFNKFSKNDITTDGFDLNRPSFINSNKDTQLVGTIYTYAVKDRNFISYEECIETIKNILNKNSKSRKAVLRFVNSITEYYNGEFGIYDVSCLNLIHYYDNNVKLIFRASDIKNELFVDIITIYWFFIKPIYEKCDITIYASTAQNINYLDNLNKNLKKIKN